MNNMFTIDELYTQLARNIINDYSDFMKEIYKKESNETDEYYVFRLLENSRIYNTYKDIMYFLDNRYKLNKISEEEIRLLLKYKHPLIEIYNKLCYYRSNYYNMIQNAIDDVILSSDI